MSNLPKFKAEINYVNYTVLRKEEILKDISESVNIVVDFLQVNATEARYLLNKYKWKSDKLLEAFGNFDDSQKFTKHVGLSTKCPDENENLVTFTNDLLECGTCMELLCPPALIGTSGCQHKFCLNCWTQYFHVKIEEAPMIDSIQCAAYECKALVEDTMVDALIKDKAIRFKYEQGIQDTFVQWHPLYRWCPAADCVYAIKVKMVAACAVKCKCGQIFCFKCGQRCHEPVPCELMQRWNLIISSGGLGNIRNCPRCGILIEKNGGCNHMCCRLCNHDFCWMCLKSTTGHVCATTIYWAEKSQEFKRVKNQFLNISMSMELELQLHQFLKTKIDYLTTVENVPVTATKFLHEAAQVLYSARQALSTSIMFVYFTKPCNQLQIFKENQANLESAVDDLSTTLEQCRNLNEVRGIIIDKFQYCDRRQKALLDHMREGYENDWWTSFEYGDARWQ